MTPLDRLLAIDPDYRLGAPADEGAAVRSEAEEVGLRKDYGSEWEILLRERGGVRKISAAH